MAQGSRQIQSQAQQQVQTLSPQQILVVKLLELPAVELEDRIHAELLENPALEEGREENAVDEYADADSAEDDAEGDANDYDSLSDYLNEDDIPDYKLQENNRSKDERAEDIPFSDTTSFYEILKEQLRERNLTEHQSELVEYLIGSLDDDGLLRKSLESICDELAIYAGIDAAEEELEEALLVLQDFDPAGLGARTLQECLLIQIRRKKEEEKTPAPILDLEERVIRDYYEEFTRKHWEKIIKKLDIGEETFKEVIGEITRLNPRPGSSLGEAIGRNLQQIIPDFIVETYDDGTIQVSLNNRHVPELRMSRDFTEMVEEHTRNKANQSKESKEAMMFLKQKMDAAQGFIDAVRQRQNTLMTTMQAIVELQRPFFLEGDESLLKPMILKDVAERTGLDISTVSRVSNSKYVQTNYGVYQLKFFFVDGYTTEDGEEMSVREIRKILKECIDGEDKKKPLTDDELADILKEKGYPIARRTVAKYRQQLNIPVARLRK
ncbi:RNA polymerase factor sigma-54 [uncultured Bacteroides sp.]|uniref:RNA polymerase factor sigma-54 n=2 Tax=uncultured Bacteroides sp. TaxID=162156 RepID=UPI0026006165|nr:RNA polymerase factor sigma-54 [uncultured Bacteroides sp.]